MAMVILSIAMPPMIGAFIDASHQSIKPSFATVASFLATERMEEIIARRYRDNTGYDAIETTINFPAENPVPNIPVESLLPPKFSFFSRSVTVTFTDAALVAVGSDLGYKKVRVSVTWNNGADEIFIERVFANFQ